MARGYMGKILNVDLSNGKIEEEALDEEMCRQYIGGYGVGARLLYERMAPSVEPIGPENILGFITGPLTGTPALIGSRFVVVGKSPKTHTWGDANCGGRFGPHLKFAGFDGVFFSGISAKPVYLFINEGKAELRDATHLWGMNVGELEDALKGEHGKDVQVASIGTGGERCSLLACIMNDKGRAAARSGLGAVMGSKRLKAVVVKGKLKVPVADEEKLRALRKKYMAEAGGLYEGWRTYGTCEITAQAAISGDSPVKNWAGAGTVLFPLERGSKISDDAVIAYQENRYHCWGCPIGCGGKVKLDRGPFALMAEQDYYGHKPEYETLAMLGTNLLNDNLESIIKLNEICNEYGLDTISLGGTIALALECFEQGILTAAEADGLELRWGNAEAIVALAEKIARREGIGEVLADGAKVAAEKIGKGAEEYAIHIQGEEIPAHDPRFTPGIATTYILDATPGRHTQGGELIQSPGYEWWPKGFDKYTYTGRAEPHYKLMTTYHVAQAAGLCMFGYASFPIQCLPDQLSAVTGWDYTMDDIYKTGMRIATIRHAFNLREGHNPLTRNVPGRIVGEPPLEEGNVRGVTVDYRTMNREFLEFVGWDVNTTVPSEESLRELDMEWIIKDLREKWKS
ncbi:MAG: aldehyde ferredoxin oxidoreductase family protein [Anaerolineae bacterium]